MKKLILIGLLVLSGCASNNAPVHMAWPDVPTDLTTPSEDLIPLPEDQQTLTDLIENVNSNFAKYYVLKYKYDAWQQWYNTQKTIHDGLTK